MEYHDLLHPRREIFSEAEGTARGQGQFNFIYPMAAMVTVLYPIISLVKPKLFIASCQRAQQANYTDQCIGIL